MGKKLTSLKRNFSVITDIDGNWFAISEYTFSHLSFSYVSLPQIENYFSCFVSFFLLLLFSSAAIFFKTAKLLDHCMQSLSNVKYQGGPMCD